VSGVRCLACLLAVAIAAPAVAVDPLFAGDPIDPATGRPAEIVPGAPWIRPGPDGRFGTADDEISSIRGDVDLVLRLGSIDPTAPIPPPLAAGAAPPRGVIEPFGGGMPLEFSIVPTDGAEPAPTGTPVSPPYLEGLPFFVVAFGDLDGDGWVGPTLRDGDASDVRLEEAELRPIGSRYVLASGGVAYGVVTVLAAGPASVPLRVALVAAAFAGDARPGFHEGVVPDGPAVMTRLPFLPVTDPSLVLTPFDLPYGQASPEGRVAMRALPAFVPDPADPRIGETFSLPVDGSEPTIDVALAESGKMVRFGAVRRADPESYLPLPTRLLRPGLDSEGRRITVETLLHHSVADDGPATTTTLRIVPVDMLGNVTAPTKKAKVKLKTEGTVRILSPDRDRKPYSEEIEVEDARGVEVVLDDAGGVFDDLSRDRLVLKYKEWLTRVDLTLADPDVDDDGLVTYLDEAAVREEIGSELGEPGFEAVLDLDGNGRIEEVDAQAVAAQRARPLVRDVYSERDRGDCHGKVERAVFRFTGGACDATTNAQGGKLECEGDAESGPVQVELTKEADKHRIEPSVVALGESFTITHRDGKLRSKTELELRGPRSVQALVLKTGCSRRLSVNDQFGGLRLIELTTTKGGTSTETPVESAGP